MPSPCLTCERRFGDKNSARCANCPDRLQYAMAQGMFPGVKQKEVKLEEVKLEVPMTSNRKEEEVQVEKLGKKMVEEAAAEVDKKPTPTQKICEEDGCTYDVLARNKCKKHYGAWRHKNPDKVKKIGRKTTRASVMDKVETNQCIQLQVRSGTDPEKRQILRRVAEIAFTEYRTIQNQIFYFLRSGVEEWERKEGKTK